MRPPSWFLALASALPLTGCSAADLVNLLTPRSGYEIRQDIAYGEGPRRTLDLYVPDQVRPGSPLVVFIYGGNWDSGAKSDYHFVGQALASRGYLTAIPDYRLYPEVRFPGFVEDAAASVAWLAERQAAEGEDDRPIVLVGHSAGAQIAMLLALDRRYLAAAGAPVCSTIAAGIGLAGPYDFLPLKEERYKRIFPEPVRAASQPIAFVDGRAPPLLLAVGDADRTVDPGNTARLTARIEAEGGEATTITYPDIGHAELIGTLARPLRNRAPLLDDLDRFIQSHAGARPPFC